MAITRTPIIDDNGSGTTGTILNNAWKTELYNQIDAAAAAGQVYSNNGSNTGTGIVTLVSVLMPAFAANDSFQVIVGLYQYAQSMTGGLYLAMGGNAIRLDDIAGTPPMAANTAGLWTGTFRANQLSPTLVFSSITGGQAAATVAGGTRYSATNLNAGSWAGGGWSFGLQCNGQTAGATQYWN